MIQSRATVVGSYGEALRSAVMQRPISCFLGVYDVFSASIAAKHCDGLFVSGYGFAASFYGLPDIGFISWTDMVAFVQRLRTVLPTHHLMVDIDDGYADVEVACHVTRLLEQIGASGVIMEDQQRPRRCGHVDGKRIMALDEFRQKLDRVLAARRELFVVARTDSADPDDIALRARSFRDAGADAVLVDGLKDLNIIRQLRDDIDTPLMFNQIEGGKSPPVTLNELEAAGISLVNYSTPCLFAVQSAIDTAMDELWKNGGRLAKPTNGEGGLARCQRLMEENLRRSQTDAANEPVRDLEPSLLDQFRLARQA